MNQTSMPNAGLPTDFDLSSVKWTRLTGGPEFDYPIDYAFFVADADAAAGKIELIFKWQPNAYCHYHRHFGTTIASVLQGEQHLDETREFETVHKVRKAGFRGPVADGDVHMEHAGPQGMTILFSIHAPDGHLFDILDRQDNVLQSVSLEDFVERRLGITD